MRREYGFKGEFLCVETRKALEFYFDRRWGIGLEYGIRKTFTDYIDDVSGTYYDNAKLLQNYGPISAGMADPSLGYIKGATSPNGDGSGAQRGETKYKDSYVFIDFSVNYKFTKKRRTRSKF